MTTPPWCREKVTVYYHYLKIPILHRDCDIIIILSVNDVNIVIAELFE